MSINLNVGHYDTAETTWDGLTRIPGRKWTCGHCYGIVGGNVGYRSRDELNAVYICPLCNKPTMFLWSDDGKGTYAQYPAPTKDIRNLPSIVRSMYDEMCLSMGSGSYTAVLMLARTLIMHVAVGLGAKKGQTFQAYVDWLVGEGYLPNRSRAWVDSIRRAGNAVNHEARVGTAEEASRVIEFSTILLLLVYDFPSRFPIREVAGA